MTHMTQRIILASLLTVSPALGQEKQFYDERLVRDLADYFGISTLEAPLGADEPRITSLDPVRAHLEDRFRSGGRRQSKQAGNSELHKPYVLLLREDGQTRTIKVGWIDLWLTNSSAGAGKAAAIYMSRLAVRFDKSSFSGNSLGDWSAHYSKDPCILFIRRNVLVRVSCDRAVRIEEADKPTRSVNDPDALGTCEDLARDIDAVLLKLPAVEKEVK